MQMSEIEKNTYTVPVMIDRTAYTSKPEGSHVGKIKTSMVRNGVVYMTMREVFNALTSGQSIIPAGLEGSLKSESWMEQSLFMLDFDGGVSLAEARERYEDAGLYPAFAYYTFSHSKDCEKFRLAFVTDDAIGNASIRDKIMATLIGLSGGAADVKCIDRARYFNGTNKGGAFYGDTIEVPDVLSLWDDSYAAFLPFKASGEASKEKSTNAGKKRSRKASGRSYEVEIEGNIIPFSTWYWRINARHNLAMLNRFFELRKWVKGDHRERFAFVYYNQAKLVYGAEEALELAKEKVGQMEEPLSEAEIYWAINHTEEHEETNMPELHGDGVFLFNRETIVDENWLDMTEAEEESCGIFRTREKNARADRNRAVKKERNELVASLFEAGKTPKEIKKVLDEQYGELSLSIRSIQRLCVRSKEECDIIPLTIKNFTPSLPQATEANGNRGCNIVPIPTLNSAQERLLDAILNGNRNILLSGVAGSGKSYILKMAIEQLEASGRSVAVCAATGMAASHFSYASTFHRLLHMDGDGYIYKEGEAMAELAGYDMVIIDEASMLEASHMESAINLLKETRKRYHKAPRLVLCFDILQLPPVDGGYFFEARNFYSLNFETHYLTENMRQTENVGFTKALNFLRIGENIASCCRYLNAMCSHDEDRDAVYLYARRGRADAKNLEILRRLPGEEIDLGNLVAKVGCEVIITENSRHDNAHQYYNGQRGVLEQVQQKRVCVRTRNGELVWLYKKTILDSSGHPVLDNNGQPLRGYPLSLAYAVTIHKSQGMTLDKANIDPDCFADGQLYVALSRVRSLDGVHLLMNLREQDCKVSKSALAFDSWMRADSRRTAV